MIGSSKKLGFTLIELVVVLGVFSIVGLAIINVYLLSINAQRQASFSLNVLTDLRYITESIARQVRVSEIDFGTKIDYDLDGTSGINGAEQELFLIDQDGNTYYYFKSGQELFLSLNKGQSLPLNNVNDAVVTSLEFYISPKTDPFFDERCSVDTDCVISNPGTCSVNEPNSDFKVGFCGCTQDSECATQNCDIDSGLCLPFNKHPEVTIVLGLESVSTKEQEKKEIVLQSTASSRIYRR